MKKKYIINRLKKAVEVGKMENASFHNDEAENERIKTSIKLWLDTWIIGPVEDALQELERKP